MTYYVEAEVYGGITGHRVSLCKSNGVVIEFATREEADAYASQQRERVRDHRGPAHFNYRVVEGP